MLFNRCFPYVMYEEPALTRCKERYRIDPRSLPEDDARWLDCKAAMSVIDPVLQNVANNELRDTLDVRAAVPWERIKPGWSKSDEVRYNGYLSHAYRLYPQTKADNAIKYAADKRRFHPIRDYLNGLSDWDAAHRVDTLLVRYLEAADTKYVRAVTRKTLVAAVARAYKPGTKFDSVLVLDGDQDIGKSSLFKELVGDEYYTETLTLTDMDDKTGAEKLQGFWAAEIPEFAGMKKQTLRISKHLCPHRMISIAQAMARSWRATRANASLSAQSMG